MNVTPPLKTLESFTSLLDDPKHIAIYINKDNAIISVEEYPLEDAILLTNRLIWTLLND